MKRKTFFVLLVCVASIAFLTSMSLAQPKKIVGPPAHANIPSWAAAEQSKIYVLNPSGQPPERAVKPMAPRLDSLEGKKIYVVSINFPYTSDFIQELAIALQQEYPQAEWIYTLKYGAYGTDDPALWQEIKENGDAMVMAVGH
jgi:hypothetical protein